EPGHRVGGRTRRPTRAAVTAEHAPALRALAGRRDVQLDLALLLEHTLPTGLAPLARVGEPAGRDGPGLERRCRGRVLADRAARSEAHVVVDRDDALGEDLPDRTVARGPHEAQVIRLREIGAELGALADVEGPVGALRHGERDAQVAQVRPAARRDTGDRHDG